MPDPCSQPLTSRPSQPVPEPPRAVPVTVCPLLAAHVAELSPLVRTTMLRRLPGIGEPLVPRHRRAAHADGRQRDRDRAGHRPGALQHLLYLSTRPDDAGVWDRACAVRPAVASIWLLPQDDVSLLLEINAQLGTP